MMVTFILSIFNTFNSVPSIINYLYEIFKMQIKKNFVEKNLIKIIMRQEFFLHVYVWEFLTNF